MTGALLILACVVAWIGLNTIIGLALTRDVAQTVIGTLFITLGLCMVAGFVALLSITIGHFA